MASLNTLSNISKTAGPQYRVHQADYVVGKMGILPIEWCGHVRVYRDEDAQRIIDALHALPVRPKRRLLADAG